MNVTRKEYKERMCNSNDKDTNDTLTSSDPDADTAGVDRICKESEFQYLEVRIHPGDWESSLFTAWIYQIVLMELVGVPATVGLTTESTALSSFYSMDNELHYSTVDYSPEGLKMSNQVHCSLTEDACVHVLPVVWNGQKDTLAQLLEDDEISIPSPNGMLGETGLYLPFSVAQDHPQLTSFLGYEGESNRELLATLFKRPTNWKEYCDRISPTKCSSPDGVAYRYPNSQEGESTKYYMQGLYIGHFESTPESDCTQSLFCQGYIVGPPCDFTNNLDAQLFWNNIVGLKRDGPLVENGGYNMSSMVEIWMAAAATQSPVLMWWFSLNEIQQLFDDTQWSLQPVLLPKPTATCLEHRTNITQRCSRDVSIRRGQNKLGACDDEVQALERVFAVSLSNANDGLEEADRSPAREMLQNINVGSLEMGDIIRKWTNKNVDRYGNDAREAVCDWVVENLDQLERKIPVGFPRRVIVRVYNSWYTVFAKILAITAAAMAGIAFGLIHKYRKTKVMVFAQPAFLYLVLIGFFSISVAAYVILLLPNDILCMAVEWLVVLGYTVTLVPVLVKTAAINRLMNSSKKMQRIRLNSNMLFVRVAVTVVIVCCCLVGWAITDPPIAEYRQELSIDDPRLIIRELECESQSMVWVSVQLSWEFLLMLMAALLVFQSRKAASVINDSKTLGVMVYSHVVFAAIRAGVVFLDKTNSVEGRVIVAMFSFNYSLDSLVGLMVYIYPKIYMAKEKPEEYLTGFHRTASTAALAGSEKHLSSGSNPRPSSLPASFRRFSLVRMGSKRPTNQDLKICVCSGNLGNAEPTSESMMAWVPPDGACNQVTPLEGVRSLFVGHFDLIVIGMQESTWKNQSDAVREQKEKKAENKEMSEDEILRAMEAHDTLALRQKVRDVLGEAYFQVAEEARGQMRLHVWAAEWVIDDIEDIKITGANTGVGNVLANKGGIVLTLNYHKTKISFLSAHLAAHEGQQYYKTRCRNLRSIFKEGKTSTLSSKIDVSLSSDHMFVLGDLNYRTRFYPEGSHEENVERAMKMINEKDYAGLYSYDELCMGIESGDLLADFKTLPCNFPPTFKVEREAGFVYKSQRTPSYTDRILYKSMASLKKHLRPLAYEPCPGYITSDHKPIRGAFSITPNAIHEPLILENEITLTFKNFACMDLPPADSNGLADPYVMIMWENDLLEEVGADLRARVRKVLFNTVRWPRTSYKPKTLNPEWRDEQIVLRTARAQVPAGSKLYIVLVDFDAFSKDDYMCTVCLDLTELLDMEPDQREKTVPVYRQLQRHARNFGRIKVQIHMKRENMARRQNFLTSRSGIFETSQMLRNMVEGNYASNGNLSDGSMSSASFESVSASERKSMLKHSILKPP